MLNDSASHSDLLVVIKDNRPDLIDIAVWELGAHGHGEEYLPAPPLPLCRGRRSLWVDWGVPSAIGRLD